MSMKKTTVAEKKIRYTFELNGKNRYRKVNFYLYKRVLFCRPVLLLLQFNLKPIYDRSNTDEIKYF